MDDVGFREHENSHVSCAGSPIEIPLQQRQAALDLVHQPLRRRVEALARPWTQTEAGIEETAQREAGRECVDAFDGIVEEIEILNVAWDRSAFVPFDPECRVPAEDRKRRKPSIGRIADVFKIVPIPVLVTTEVGRRDLGCWESPQLSSSGRMRDLNAALTIPIGLGRGIPIILRRPRERESIPIRSSSHTVIARCRDRCSTGLRAARS